MKKGSELEKIGENIEIFLTVVEISREKMSITDSVHNLKMVYNFDTDDFEIFMDQVGGRCSSLKQLKNVDSCSFRNKSKPKLKKKQAKKVNAGTDYFISRIHKAANKQKKIEVIILEHNFDTGVTYLFIGYPAQGNH